MIFDVRGRYLSRETPKRIDLRPSLSLLEENPFAPFEEMEINYSDELLPYNRRIASDALMSNEDMAIAFRKEGSFYLDAFLIQHPTECGSGINFSEEYVKGRVELERIANYVQQWRKILPAFLWAQAGADDRENEFWMDVAKTSPFVWPLSDCFGSRLGWYHLMSPRGYQEYFKREDLLATPAFRVEELDDGCIAIQSYEHPLAFADESVTRDIIAITTYLNQRRLD